MDDLAVTISNTLHDLAIAGSIDPSVTGGELCKRLRQEFMIYPKDRLVCTTHDAIPITSEEQKHLEEGSEPCIMIIRVFEEEIVT